MSHSLLTTKAIFEKELPEMVVQMVANAFNPVEEGLEVSPRVRGFPSRSNASSSCVNHPRLLLIPQKNLTFWEIWTAPEGSSTWEWRQDLSCPRTQDFRLVWQQLLFPPKAECSNVSTAPPNANANGNANANLAVSITDATREQVEQEDFGSEDDEETRPTAPGQLPADRSQCYLCGKMMKKKSLSLHVKLVHHDERVTRLECPQCHKAYKTQNALVKHSRIHSGERPYCCSICGKTYRDNDLWNNCQRRCSGNFRYRCGICDKQFNSKFRLNNHELIHSGEKPYRCPLCPYRCNRKDNLALHVKKKHHLNLKAAELGCGGRCDEGDS